MRILRVRSAEAYGLLVRDTPKELPGVPISIGFRRPVIAIRATMNSIPTSENLMGRISPRLGLKRNRSGETRPNPMESEESIEKSIYRCRFLTLFAVLGSLAGSVLCFIKGCNYVVDAFVECFLGSGKMVLLLVEAIDVYLIGTVMFVFGMGLYELFVSTFDVTRPHSLSFVEEKSFAGSNLFGMFKLMERPKWLEIQSINELKTKLGHVIVMILLVGLFEKSKKVVISSPLELLCFTMSILLSSGSLLLLAKINHSKHAKK